MNKYQNQISLAKQPKYPHKKPAHQKKNPVAHQAGLAYKKARNQAQYRKRDLLATRCSVCHTTKPLLTKGIEEKHYQNSLRIVKELFFEMTNLPPSIAKDNRQYIKSVFYCSLKCFNFQAEQTERKDLAKGGGK